jgi:hypothetical protein
MKVCHTLRAFPRYAFQISFDAARPLQRARKLHLLEHRCCGIDCRSRE